MQSARSPSPVTINLTIEGEPQIWGRHDNEAHMQSYREQMRRSYTTRVAD